MNDVTHRFEDRLLELAYGELPRHEAEALELHVRECRRCAAALEEIREVRALARTLTPAPAPAAGLDSLLGYAAETARRNADDVRARRSLWRRWLPSLAPLVALGLVAAVAWELRGTFVIDPAAVAMATDEARQRQSAEASSPAVGAPAPGVGMAEVQESAKTRERPAMPASSPRRSSPSAALRGEREPGAAETRNFSDFSDMGGPGEGAASLDDARRLEARRRDVTAEGKGAPAAMAPPPTEPRGRSLSLPGLRARMPSGPQEDLGEASTGERAGARRDKEAEVFGAAGTNTGTNDGTSLRQGWESNAVTGGALGLRAGLSREDPAPEGARSPAGELRQARKVAKAWADLGPGEAEPPAAAESRPAPQSARTAAPAVSSQAAPPDVVARALASAKAARTRGEAGAARAFAREALAAGAVGAQRRLVLELLCELPLPSGPGGQDEAACEALALEYPESAIAQRWAARGVEAVRGKRAPATPSPERGAREIEAR